VSCLEIGKLDGRRGFLAKGGKSLLLPEGKFVQVKHPKLDLKAALKEVTPTFLYSPLSFLHTIISPLPSSALLSSAVLSSHFSPACYSSFPIPLLTFLPCVCFISSTAVAAHLLLSVSPLALSTPLLLGHSSLCACSSLAGY